MKVNYQRVLEEEIQKNLKLGIKPRLLLHSCCAPCSTYVISYLVDYFEVTIYFFNPNIFPEDEYQKRLEEQIRLAGEMEIPYEVEVVGEAHQANLFYSAVKGLEKVPEGGSRCMECFKVRLERTAQFGKENHFDYFATTLTISPLKNAKAINEIGLELEAKFNVKYLQSDFKKKDGFKKSVELSSKHGLYRQDYCGCIYSKQEMKERNWNGTD